MSYKRKDHGFTSIYSAPPKPQPRSESTPENYDYLDSADHSGYTNAWLNAVSYNKVSVDYNDDEYAANWLNFIKTKERKIQYTRSQLFDVLFQMAPTMSPIDSFTPETIHEPIDFLTPKTIYQPIRQPDNPPDNIVKGFFNSTRYYQLCAKCRARIV